MAESVSDQNVEDMLSSVRRLVSSELPRNQRPSLSEGASALVLTQAQRVEPKPPMQSQRGLTLEERIAELEAAVDGQTHDWEPDGSEDQDEHRPDRIVYRPSRLRTEAESQRPLRLSEIALIETGPAHDDQVDDRAEATSEAPQFQHDVSEDQVASDEPEAEEQVMADSPSEAVDEPDTPKTITPPAEFSDDPFASAIARDVAAVVAEMAENSLNAEKDFEAALAEAVRDPAETRGLPRSGDAEASTSPEEPGTAPQAADVEDMGTTQTDQEWEDAETADAEPTEVEQFDEDKPLVLGHPAEDDTAEAGEPVDLIAETDNESENLLALSPEQLRLLISTMIRQELQGELGERITRNVRKMVRQEVHRALSVRDLE